jgi:hypothetical protein
MRLIFGALCTLFVAVGTLSLWLVMPEISKSMIQLGVLLFVGSLIVAILVDQLAKLAGRHGRDADADGHEFLQTVISIDGDRD